MLTPKYLNHTDVLKSVLDNFLFEHKQKCMLFISFANKLYAQLKKRYYHIIFSKSKFKAMPITKKDLTKVICTDLSSIEFVTN